MKTIKIDPNQFLAPLATVLMLLIGIFIYGKVFGGVSIVLNDGSPERTFTVDGVGKAEAVPNKFTANFTISETAPTQDEAQELGTEKQNDARDILTGLGFADEDIKTAGYYINENYDFQNNGELSGYRIDITTEITSENVEMINQALDRLVDLNLNVSGVQSVVDDNIDDVKQEARKKAVENAKKKAEQLAEAGGFELGKIASINESEGMSSPPYPVLMERGLDMSAPALESVQIDPGSQDVTVHVNITYYIKD